MTAQPYATTMTTRTMRRGKVAAVALTFLADRASLFAGGGDMVLLGSDVMLVRAGGFSFDVFCSSVAARSGPLAGEAVPFTLLLAGADASPTGALLVPIDSWRSEATSPLMF